MNQKTVITGTKRNYAKLKPNDYSLKICFPEVVDLALKELAEYTGNTVADIIRSILFTYLYGQYDLFANHERDQTIKQNPKQSEFIHHIQLSSQTMTQNVNANLGKNMYCVKVLISEKMRGDLKELADQVNLTLSHFIREIFISRLFGHVYLPEREALLGFIVTLKQE